MIAGFAFACNVFEIRDRIATNLWVQNQEELTKTAAKVDSFAMPHLSPVFSGVQMD